MSYSHSDSTATAIHGALMKLRYEDEIPVATLARMAGCSESLIYTWSDAERAAAAPARYVMALATGLAREFENFRLINLLLPIGTRVVVGTAGAEVDGRIDDEVTDATLAMAQMAAAHRGRDPEAMAQARRLAQKILRRTEGEEALLRQSLALA
ncbi:MAG: hypothetical protein AAGI52_06435 [Bacteroidota bacterium]